MKNFLFSEDRASLKILRKLELKVEKNESVIRKILFFSGLTWLPLLILTLINNTAINSDINISFLKDFETYTKFLIGLPALFIADNFIKYQISNAQIHFVESGIISGNNEGLYETYLKKYRSLEKSEFAQVLIFILAFIIIYLLRSLASYYGKATSWKTDSGTESFTAAGYWYTFISLPLLKYFTLRLVWKFLLWSWFLRKLSKMDLNLVAIDPDRSGGLGFLGTVQISFGILGFAQSAFLSSEIANKVMFSGVPLEEFKIYFIIIPVITIIYLTPLFFFYKVLSALKLNGIMIFGALSHKYSLNFNDKWVKGIDFEEKEPLLGSADIQSLADIGTSFEVVETMRTLPFSLRNTSTMLILIALPLLPLLTLKYDIMVILEAIAGFIL